MSWRAEAALKRHFADLQRLGHLQYKNQLACLYGFLQQTAVYRAICEMVRASEPDFSADDWITTHIVNSNRGTHLWPSSEPQRMKVLLRAIERLAEGSEKPEAWGMHMSYGRSLDTAVERVTEEIIAPFLNFVVAEVNTASAALHLVGRFKRHVEWFEQQQLFDQATADTSKSEDVYDTRLRRFLFEEGVDYPFSKPRSASGEADVVADIDTDDPLVCEVKLFDDDRYKVPAIAKGVRQAIRYAHDYGKAVAHLVVINLSEKRLSLPSEVQSAPPRIVVEGVTLFMIVVQGRPRPSASKEKPVETVKVEREHLLREVEE
jgi:hypothetical protein